MDSQTAQQAAQPVEHVGVGARCLVALVRLYQVSLGLLMGGHCRFHPTCSEYSIQALRTHGAIRGFWLTIRRISRCHPLGGSGFDPVPPVNSRSNQLELHANSETIHGR